LARPKKYPERPDGHINVAEVCRVLGVSRATLYRYREANDFPVPVEMGGQVWYSELAIRQWAERRAGRPLEVPWITGEPAQQS